MSNTSKTSSSCTITDSCSHYQITRTITDSDGKTHTETVKVVEDDATKVSSL